MRESLVQCCQSVDSQQHEDWQHVIALDCAPEDINDSLLVQVQHPKRFIFCCGKKYGHYGNHARWMAWEKTKGDYLLALDDDNELFHVNALADIACSLESANLPDFAIFPIHRHGRIFFNDPPGMCMTDSMNLVVKRHVGRWPDIESREADGYFVEALKYKYKYATFPNVEAIGLMRKSSNGI